jgi:tetratricopeptide (TPR) repeat protein
MVLILVAGITALALGSYVLRERFQRGPSLAQVEAALADNNLAHAEELLRQVLKDDVENLQAQVLRAQVLRRLGRVEESQHALGQALDRGMAEEAARREYVLLEAARNFPRAESWLRQLARDQPADIEVAKALAEGYLNTHRWPEAERACTRWLELQPESVDIRFARGQARQENRHFELAADDFRAVLRQMPDHFSARLLLAHCLLSDARISEAEPELRVCRRLAPQRPEPLIGLAACAIEREDWDEAQALLSDALTFDPKSSAGLHEQGNLYLLRQRFDRAIPIFERVLKLNPRDAQAHLKLAQAMRKEGDTEGARQHARRYEELAREQNPPPRAP